MELVSVMLLLAILSTVALSRSVRPDSFAAAIAANFLVEELRYARRLAMNRQDIGIVVVLSEAGDTWVATLQTPASLVLRQRTAPRDGTVLQGPGESLDVGETFVFSLDGAGRLTAVTLAGTPVAPQNGIELAVVGGRSIPICLYPSGYATEAACV